MKKFLFKLLAFFCMTVLTALALSFVPKFEDKNNFMAAMIQKHERLEAIESPKMILAGGSSMAFGVNSERLQEEFAMPVVNLSILAGLGTPFILEELKHSIASGDVVFLSLEYFLDDGQNRLKKRASDLFPPAADYYTMSAYAKLELHLEDVRESLKTKLKVKIKRLLNPAKKSLIAPIYFAGAFNEYGDVVSHLEQENRATLDGKELLEYRYWEQIPRLNAFYAYASTKGVKVFYLFPPLAQSQYAINKEAIHLLQDDLYRDLKIEIINKPSSAAFPDSLYFDTIYHLNKEGRERRTTKMIALIKQLLND